MGDLSEIRLKWAEEKDVASIVGLVLELAEFERELESVKLSEEQMKRDLCDKHFVCVIAQNEREEAVGMALCHNRYSTWDGLCVHLEDLYVKPDYRQRGIGRLLIEACVKYTHGLGCKRLCWEVLDWNTNAIKFYKGFGAELKETWRCCRLSGKELDGFEYKNEKMLEQLSSKP
jgi:GNAT superfamily N-acetyltransferase